MENAIVAKTSIVKKMDAEFGKCANGYIRFAGLVGICRVKEAYRDEGYNTVYDLCKERYNMSRGTVGNLCRIYESFCDAETGKILPEYEGKGVTALLAELEPKNKKHAKSGEPAEGENPVESGESVEDGNPTESGESVEDGNPTESGESAPRAINVAEENDITLVDCIKFGDGNTVRVLTEFGAYDVTPVARSWGFDIVCKRV